MLDDLENSSEISRLSEELLNRADAAGRWPTRVDDMVASVDLVEPAESPFSAGWLARAPRYLRKAVSLVNSRRIRAVLDRRERAVYLDPTIEHEGRRRFLRLHEVSHDMYPWQRPEAFADDDLTLSRQTKRLFEREANQGAAQLLFQGDRFRAMAADYRIGMAAIAELSTTVGASLRATLRQYVETHREALCGIVLEPSPVSVDPLVFRRNEVSQSVAWTARFGQTWPRQLDARCHPFLGVIQAPDEMSEGLRWPDLNSEPVSIRAEAITNRFAVLLLLWVPGRELFKRKRALVQTG